MSVDKQFVLDKDGAADFLQDIIDAIENKDAVRLEGQNWKVSQPTDDKVPVRIFSDEEGLEVMFKVQGEAAEKEEEKEEE
ncbi:hypothetical protein GKQ38_02730 [Candidatus Nanohaloarchaea archaeon]|nr:hypothetical protein GKQ38_02730 [Candidatus Nanohaloarchaea archaeon]